MPRPRARIGGLHWRSLQQRHLDAANALLDDPAETRAWLEAQFAQLAELLRAVGLLRQPGRAAFERIQGMGEVLSSRLLHAHLRERGGDYALLDARDVLLVQPGELAIVDWEESTRQLAAWKQAHPQSRAVATGFVASGKDGLPTVLGRNGSDFSAAIFASLFDADELHIWSDVDGVLSADPRLVPGSGAAGGDELSGSLRTRLLRRQGDPPADDDPGDRARPADPDAQYLQPGFAGTRIDADGGEGGPVKGLTLNTGLALVSLEGAGLIGVPGTAERVFAALHAAKISVVMISQGSSEHSSARY